MMIFRSFLLIIIGLLLIYLILTFKRVIDACIEYREHKKEILKMWYVIDKYDYECKEIVKEKLLKNKIFVK